MRFIGFEREEEAEAWARARLELENAPGFFRAMSAVDENDEFVCVVVMTNFTQLNIDLSIVIGGKGLMPKGMLVMFNEVFGFVFDTMRVARVTGLLRGKNTQAKRINEHFGFKLEGVMRKSFADDDLHIYGFLAEDYHSHVWYRGQYGN
jgi:RimJ/RimL family protein N-acetyltransferase